ncbi:MAG: tetratricopeptide repeat protein, partial [Spirochaetales bacterium]
VYLYLAYNYEKQGQAQQAMRILEEALAKSGDGDGKEILLKLADLKLRSKLYGDAALLYESYLSRFGSAGAAGASYSLGFCYTALGDFTKARAVLESALKYGESSNLLPGIYRLLAIVYKQQRDEKNLKSCLEQYLGLLPGDREARLEYISLIFGQGDYLLTAEQIEALYSAEPALRQKDTPGSAKPAYLYGLSKIGTKHYEEAFVSLAGMGPPDSYKNQADKNFVQSVYAGLVYYRGWALYRLSRFSEAEKEFAFYLKTFPAGANTAKVNYYAGWCSYSLGDFPKAGVYFHAAALVMKDGGLFMEAKSLAAAGELTRAAVLFRTLSTQFPSSALKDDAVFEEASVLAEMEKADESASLFLTLHANLAAAAARTPGQPPNPLMEESLYRRAEVLFGAGKYVEARNAYYDYRLKYPGGKFMDVSLYSGGAASMKLSEPFAALLLWEKLAAEFPQSGYRSEALRQTAEIYKARQEYVKALAVFREVTAQYPETAKLYRLDVEISALELMLSGKSAEEAQLTARISNLRGAETREGREAMLSLARYYLAQGPSGLESALGVLTRIVEREQSDTVSSAKARYLLGEYYFRKGELKQAAAEFFTAAGTNPADADLSASALYRAAEILLDAGYRTDAADIIGIISAKYPGTVWEAEGSRLLGVKK